MIKRSDFIIVGGSFAGLAYARTVALLGLKVAVVDRKSEPLAHVRTTGIVVKEASDGFDLPARLMRKVRGVRLYAPNERSLDLSAPGYFFQATDTPVTGGGIHTALHFDRRVAQLVSDYLGDRGPHLVGALTRDAPRFRIKRVLRRLLDTAPSNTLINAFLMISPMKAQALRMYFHSRSGSVESFEAWSKEFEPRELQSAPPQLPGPTLRLI